MTTKDSPPLPVRQTISNPNSPRKITFVFSTPYLADLYQSVLTITENTQLSGFHGTISRGLSAAQGGTSGIQAGSDVFDPLWNFVQTHPRIVVTITYDDTTFNVINVSAASVQAVINLDLLDATLASLGSVDIGAGIESLNRIANALTQGPPLGLTQTMDSAPMSPSDSLTAGGVHISAGIESLNRIANILSLGLQRLTPMMDSAPPPPPSGNGATEPLKQ